MARRFGNFLLAIFIVAGALPAIYGLLGATIGHGSERWVAIWLAWIVAAALWLFGYGLRTVFAGA